jgi:hypothetical protein
MSRGRVLVCALVARGPVRFRCDDDVRRYGKIGYRRRGDRRQVQASRQTESRREGAPEQARFFPGTCQGNAGLPADWPILLLNIRAAQNSQELTSIKLPVAKP